MNTTKKQIIPEQLNQKVGMPTLAGTNTQLQLHCNDILSNNIQDLKRPGNTGHNKAPKTRDEENSTNQQINSQRNPEPVQEITRAMITQLSKVTASDVQGKIFCLKAMFPDYDGKEEKYQ